MGKIMKLWKPFIQITEVFNFAFHQKERKKEKEKKSWVIHFGCDLSEKEAGILITCFYITRVANNYTVILHKLNYLYIN